MDLHVLEEALGLPADPRALTEHSGRWRPWRAYGALHLANAGISSADLKESDNAKRAA
jgi:AraC family transcriptional regulator of adaptative response / DNA-3-methyladenine glycosylase II